LAMLPRNSCQALHDRVHVEHDFGRALERSYGGQGIIRLKAVDHFPQFLHGCLGVKFAVHGKHLY